MKLWTYSVKWKDDAVFSKIRIQNIYEQKDDYTIIHIIGGILGDADVLIDNEDVEKCKKYNWTIVKAHSTKNARLKYYVQASGYLLHRYLTDCPKGLVVDRIDGNSFNNRRYNLRICTNKDNTRKTVKQINNKSGKKGVYWDVHLKNPKWKAFIKVNRRYLHLGYFVKFEDAVKARIAAEKKYFGDFAPTEDIDETVVGVPIIHKAS